MWYTLAPLDSQKMPIEATIVWVCTSSAAQRDSEW